MRRRGIRQDQEGARRRTGAHFRAIGPQVRLHLYLTHEIYPNPNPYTGDDCSMHYFPLQFQGCGGWEIKELDSTRRQEGRGCKNDSIHIKFRRIHLTRPCWVSVEKVDVQAVLRRRQHHRQGIHQARPRTAQNSRHPGIQRAGVVHFGDGGDFRRSVPIAMICLILLAI